MLLNQYRKYITSQNRRSGGSDTSPAAWLHRLAGSNPPMQFGSAIKGLISLIIFFYAVLTKSSRKYYTFYKRKIEIQENAFFPSASELDLRPRWGLVKLWKGEATLIKIISLVFYLLKKFFLSSDSFYFKKYFICLAAAGLNCSTKDLLSGLQHAESLVAARGV